jgi:CheY-like chemotaxis protein
MTTRTTPMRILLIEDDIDDSMFFRDALNETGLKAEVKIATRCNNILDVIGTNPSTFPDLIFLDLHMPMVSGHECLQIIRSQPQLHSIPIIIYSTSASSFDIEQTFAGGAALYLTKPSSFQLLVTAMKKIMQLDWKNYEAEKTRENFVYKHNALNPAAA